MSTTLVTGATGLIGRHLVPMLLAAGDEVRVLVRQPERLDPAVAAHVEIVRGDIRDGRAIDRAVAGARTVLHLAACARAWSRDPREFESCNVTAVRTLLAAAGRSRVERLVHVSTILTLPPWRPACVGGAAARPTPYESTKRAGERLVEEYAAAGGHAVIVHPTRVYGPGPLNDANGVTRVVAAYLAGRFRLGVRDGDAQANYVHVGDVAAGIVLAARHGGTGAHFVIGGENRSLRGFLAAVDAAAGLHRRIARVPPAFALAIAGAAEVGGRAGLPVPVTRGWVRALLEDRRADSGPAMRTLGYRPRPLDEGLRDTIAWLASGGRRCA